MLQLTFVFSQGDSGSGLVCLDDRRSPMLAGVASYVIKRRAGELPGVFMRVSGYRHWIDEVIRDF